jgi:hypothetical protein
MNSPEGATDCGSGVSRSHNRENVFRRFAAGLFFPTVFLGLTPQAMSLSRLRRWLAIFTGFRG